MSDAFQDRLSEATRTGVTSTATHALLREMSAEAEHVARSRPSVFRRFKRRTLITAAAVALLGGGTATAAAAAPVVARWLGFIPDTSTTLILDSGITCYVGYHARPGYGSDQDARNAAAAGQEYLRTLNLSSLPLDERVAENTKNGRSVVGYPSLDVSTALGELVAEGMWTHLRGEGYDGSGISLEGGADCGSGAQK